MLHERIPNGFGRKVLSEHKRGIVDTQITRNPFYNSKRWQTIRTKIIADELCCRLCDEAAECVDHLDGRTDHNSRPNLVALCNNCHSWKTNKFDKEGCSSLSGITNLIDLLTATNGYNNFVTEALRHDPEQLPSKHVCDFNRKCKVIDELLYASLHGDRTFFITCSMSPTTDDERAMLDDRERPLESLRQLLDQWERERTDIKSLLRYFVLVYTYEVS